jgi:hypothetical protein
MGRGNGNNNSNLLYGQPLIRGDEIDSLALNMPIHDFSDMDWSSPLATQLKVMEMVEDADIAYNNLLQNFFYDPNNQLHSLGTDNWQLACPSGLSVTILNFRKCRWLKKVGEIQPSLRDKKANTSLKENKDQLFNQLLEDQLHTQLLNDRSQVDDLLAGKFGSITPVAFNVLDNDAYQTKTVIVHEYDPSGDDYNEVNKTQEYKLHYLERHKAPVFVPASNLAAIETIVPSIENHQWFYHGSSEQIFLIDKRNDTLTANAQCFTYDQAISEVGYIPN